MTVNLKNSSSHLRGMNRLAFDAVVGITGLVEAMHGNIAELRGPFSRARGRTSGITRLVYSSIRGITRLTGAGVDATLGALDPFLPVEPSTPRLEAARAQP